MLCTAVLELSCTGANIYTDVSQVFRNQNWYTKAMISWIMLLKIRPEQGIRLKILT